MTRPPDPLIAPVTDTNAFASAVFRRVAPMLGLAADAEPDAVLAHCQALTGPDRERAAKAWRECAEAERYARWSPIATALRDAGLEADARDPQSCVDGLTHAVQVRADLCAAQAKLAELDRQREGREREQLIERGQRIGKITPHMAAAARGTLTGTPWPLEQLRAVLLHGGRIVPEALTPPPSAPMKSGGRDLSADAAMYAAMTFTERAALAKDDPTTHDELRAAWLKAGAPITTEGA